jgi:hypothetical protein
MEKGTFTILMGCGDTRTTLTLKHSGKVDLWYENKLKDFGINPENITGVLIGKGLVIELFSDPHFAHLSDVIENNTNPDGHKYEVGCFDDHPIWKGVIRSFKVWNYWDYHANGRLVRYCDTDNECGEDELCLCKGGERLKEWCPRERKRCLNKGLYFHSARRTTWDPDLINTDCMLKLMKDYNVKWPMYGHIKNFAKICQKKPNRCKSSRDIRVMRKPRSNSMTTMNIEGFNSFNKNSNYNTIHIILVIIIFFLFLKIQ